MMFNPIRIIAICFFAWLVPELAVAQSKESITLAECYEWAHANYPLIKQFDLIDKSREFNLTNASRSNLPRVELKGQASYQSDVTQIPISLPNLEIPEISKDQYKLYLDLYLPMTNRAEVASARRKIQVNSAIEKQEVEIELFKLRDRINQIYFGVLLLDGQSEQLQIILGDLSSAYSKTLASVENGVAIESNLDLIVAERIGIEQKILENQIMRQAFVEMLATLTNQDITSSTLFGSPPDLLVDQEISRPELRLYELKNESLNVEFDRVSTGSMPNAGLFFQGGYGRPAINFLSNNFDAYYLGGVRLNWNLSSFYTKKEEKQTLILAQEKVENSKATFLLNSELRYKQQSGEVRKYIDLIASDQRLIELRKAIKETAELQLSNGLTTALDFIDFINAEGRARQDKVLHEVQLLRAKYELNFIAGG